MFLKIIPIWNVNGKISAQTHMLIIYIVAKFNSYTPVLQ